MMESLAFLQVDFYRMELQLSEIVESREQQILQYFTERPIASCFISPDFGRAEEKLTGLILVFKTG